MINKINLLCLTSLVALGVASPVFQTINSNEFLPSYASYGYPEASNDINSEHYFTGEDYTIDGYSDVVSDLSELGLLNEYTSGIIAFEEQFVNNDIKLFLYVIHVDIFRRGTNSVKFNYNGETLTKDLDLVSKIDKDEYSTYFKFLVKDFSPDKNDTRKYIVEQFKGKVFYSKFHAEEVTFTKGVKGDSNHLVKNSYYFHGNNAAELESVIESEAVVTVTNKQIVSFCFGETLSFFDLQSEAMIGGNEYSDVWYCLFSTDHDYRMENLSKVKINYRQYDFQTEDKKAPFPQLQTSYSFTVDEIKKCPTFSYVDHTETITPGKSEITSIEYGWFWSKTTVYTWADDVIDLNEYSQSETGDFVFNDFKSQYRWGVHFATTERKYVEKVTAAVPGGCVKGSVMDQVTLLELTYFDTVLGKTLTSKVSDVPSDSNDNISIPVQPSPDDPEKIEYPWLEPWNNFWENTGDQFMYIIYIILGVLGIFLLAFVSVKLVRVITSLSNKSKIRRLDNEDKRKRKDERKKK